MTHVPDAIDVASLRTHCLILTISNDGQSSLRSSMSRTDAATVLGALADDLAPAAVRRACLDELFTGQPCPGHASAAEPFVPRTERQHWQNITDALNAANEAGMPVGIDLDGTLTDHNSWSVVWNPKAGRWELAGYDDDATSAQDPTTAPDPVPLRWGLDDVLHGDDDTVTVCLSGPAPDRRPYALELDPDRAQALRDALAPLDSRPTPSEAALTRVLAWCDDLDQAVRLQHMDPDAEHPHAIAVRTVIAQDGTL